MRIKKLWPSVFWIILAGCAACNQYESYDWGDPVEIPDHPAFIWNCGPDANTITVLDLEKEEIVGIRRVLPEQASTYDFEVFGDNELFFPLDYLRVHSELGDEVVIIDPSRQEQKIGSITVYPGPAGLFPLDDGKAFVSHAFRSFEDSFWTTTLIDMQARKVLAEFSLSDAMSNAIEFPDERIYVFYSGWGGSEERLIREFNPKTNSLGEEVGIGEPGFYPYSAVVIDDSLICAFADWSENENTYRSIEIVQIPSCSTVASVSLTEKYPDRMLYLNNKLYVCHNNGDVMEYGNVSKVSVVDIESRSVTKVLDVCNAPCDIAYCKATNKIVVVSHVGTVITIIDPDTDEVINTIVSDEVGDVDDEWGYDRLRIPE